MFAVMHALPPSIRVALAAVLLVSIAVAQATAPASRRKLTSCCGRPSVIGRPGRISWSLPNAMFEPQKETEPMTIENSVGMNASSGISPPRLSW